MSESGDKNYGEIMERKDRIEFWTHCWDIGNTGWHVTHYNNTLLRCYNQLISSKQGASADQVRIFVPLCGKSWDLKWLYEQGNYIVGIEAVPQPIQEFFKESELEYKTTQIPSIKGKLHQTLDKRLNIYECDLFNFSTNLVGEKFDALWDRGSLIAIYEEDRPRYGQLMKSVLKPDFHYLLNVVEYKSSTFSGPPRVITRETIDELYADHCNIELIATSKGNHPLAGKLTSLVYMLTPLHKQEIKS